MTGQASFDFIEAADDGKTYAIECDPRTHSAITLFYNDPALANAYLGDAALPKPLTPASTSKPTYWIYHEVWRLLTHLHLPRATAVRLRIIFSGKDAVFDWTDPLPFFMLGRKCKNHFRQGKLSADVQIELMFTAGASLRDERMPYLNAI